MPSYIIVRKPKLVEIVPGILLQPVGDIYYHGIDRMQWYDLDTIVFEGKLPERLKELFLTLKDSGNYLSLTRVVAKREDAEAFLSIGGEWVENNEVIVLHSKTIDMLGLHTSETASVGWLGYDVTLLGGWSLIKHGVFENRQFSLLQYKQLNSYGLFDDLKGIEGFLAEYDRLGELDKVDPLLNLIVEGVRVGRPISYDGEN